MGYIERLQELVSCPLENLPKTIQPSINSLFRKFMEGEIDLTTLADGLRNLENKENILVLPYPGPLYGLLRKIGLDKKTCCDLAFEERAHYTVAEELKLKETRIILELAKDNFDKKILIVSLAFNLPENKTDEEFRLMMRKLALAPKAFGLDPSPDDLEILSEMPR